MGENMRRKNTTKEEQKAQPPPTSKDKIYEKQEKNPNY